MDQYRIVDVQRAVSPDGLSQALLIDCRLELDGQEVPARITVRPRLDREIIVHGALSAEELAKVLGEAADQWRKFRQAEAQLAQEKLQTRPLPVPALTPAPDIAPGKP